MRAEIARRPPSEGNPAFVYRLTCDTVSLGFIFCTVPVVVQHVLFPAGIDYITVAFLVIIIIIPANAFVVFLFDKWTPRVLRIMSLSVALTLADSTIMLVASCAIGASGVQNVLFIISNIIFLVCNFHCASIARSTKENILLFWNIDRPIKEKPATYVALLLVATMLALCLVEWRLVYLIGMLLVLVLPIMTSKVQRAMKGRLAVDPDIATRYSGAYTAPVFSRSAFVHVAEKIVLSVLLILTMAAFFSSPLPPAGLDVLLPGGSAQPLSTTLLVYVFAFIALGSTLMALFWLLMRKYHTDLSAREKIAVICIFFAIIEIVVSVAIGGIAGLIPAPVYRVWSFVSNVFFSMEMLYVILIVFDFIPSKRVEFVGQLMPMLVGTTFFLWIFTIADTLSTTRAFFIPGLVTACLLLVYYVLYPRVRSARLHGNTRETQVTQVDG